MILDDMSMRKQGGVYQSTYYSSLSFLFSYPFCSLYSCLIILLQTLLFQIWFSLGSTLYSALTLTPSIAKNDETGDPNWLHFAYFVVELIMEIFSILAVMRKYHIRAYMILILWAFITGFDAYFLVYPFYFLQKRKKK